MLFITLYTFLILQRLLELGIAKRNEIILKKQGAIEWGKGHYRYIVLLHAGFFVSLFVEVYWKQFPISSIWHVYIVLFLLLQALRIWTLCSLGRFWNTKVIVLPGAKVKKSGPFQYIRHPNYVVVTFEVLTIPLLFNAYFTASIFTILNVLLLWFVRIPAEERALGVQSNYEDAFENISRFLPKQFKRTR